MIGMALSVVVRALGCAQEEDAKKRIQPSDQTPPKEVGAPPEQAQPRPDIGGYKIAEGELGELRLGLFTYARYLYQKGLEDSYTDDFGRTRPLDLRQDIQLQKAKLNFMGWFLDPDFNYLIFVWTSNSNMGQGAQVVVAGNLTYRLNEDHAVGAGINPVPVTRTLEGSFPRFLKVDNRTIADEFFRGGYTTGVWLQGRAAEGLNYKVMLGNNLSQLGVDSVQLDNTLDTVSASLVWMPSTGEFGPGGGFGDLEHHEELATRIGFHATHSTEERQSQPGTEDPENTQIRLSDGTGIFEIDAFAPGTQVQDARYQVITVDAGMKYRGFSLEGEYYFRWITDIHAAGDIGVDRLYDHGFQLQASAMAVPKRLQVYLAGSKIFGEYGDPWDACLGLNWFPFSHEGYERQFRVNAELIYLNESPTGNSTVPYIVGGDGPVFVLNTELSF